MNTTEALAALEASNQRRARELQVRIDGLWPNLSEEQRATVGAQTDMDGMNAVLGYYECGDLGVDVIVHQHVRYTFEANTLEEALKLVEQGMWPDDNNVVVADRVIVRSDSGAVLSDSNPALFYEED